MKNWYQLSAKEVLEDLDVHPEIGLSSQEAERRLGQHGLNELVEQGGRKPLRILWEQFTAIMVLILIAAAVLSGLLGEFKDALAIGAIVILFALLGFVQEYRAERALAALKRLVVPLVRVQRDGSWGEISARQLVPGDILHLEAGSIVPADLRLLESANLRIQEAALTGESQPVEKIADALPGRELALGDRLNMAYMGTTVTYGRGAGVVVASGMRTELGKIAGLLQAVKAEQTPLQSRLDRLGKRLALVGLVVAVGVFVLGLLRGDDFRHMLLTAVSIAVAIVPEGLPAVVTITLALGAQRMLRRSALIRKLPAVETLGSVTVICSDKTGTLTENRMTVVVLDVAGHSLPLRAGDAIQTGPHAYPTAITWMLVGSALCNDARLQSGDSGALRALGDPTEAALLVAATQAGFNLRDLSAAVPRVGEMPFDSERKRMTTLHRIDALPIPAPPSSFESPFVAFTKGSVDGLLEISARVWTETGLVPLDETWRARIMKANDELAQQGMRVLGLALRLLPDLPASISDNLEQDLVFVGLVGMIDPPRQEARAAVALCRQAGIRPVMITGDHPLTARQIALELGILAGAGGPAVITGAELDSMSPAELDRRVSQVSVFARVSPEHKLRIVEALQRQGQVVAMTGDGVNDAPALRRANIGVAMGITGTDVAKEAAEMVLQDDNFATIVAAVEEGRTIFDNLRKFIKFSVAGNIGKVSVMLLAPFLGKPIPLLPLQLLWLNLLTDGLLGLGLGLEPPERDVMRRPPLDPNEGIFSPGLRRHVVWVGALIGGISLVVGYLYWRMDPGGVWQTMVFTTLAFSQLAQALASRSARDSLFQIGAFSNPAGLAIALLTFGLQLAVVYVPFLQNFFRTRPLSLADLAISLALGSSVFIAIELEKAMLRRHEAGR